jgi:PadR family transcriptional regulator AphA
VEIQVVRHAQRSFVKGTPGRPLLTVEKDVVELIGICGEHETDRLLLFAENLPKKFFDLSSGEAGMVLQKFVNYHLKVAAVVPPEYITGKFSEFVLETNRGRQFRVFQDLGQAERWLLSD